MWSPWHSLPISVSLSILFPCSYKRSAALSQFVIHRGLIISVMQVSVLHAGHSTVATPAVAVAMAAILYGNNSYGNSSYGNGGSVHPSIYSVCLSVGCILCHVLLRCCGPIRRDLNGWVSSQYIQAPYRFLCIAIPVHAS